MAIRVLMALRTEVVPVELNDFEEQDIHYATLDVLIFMYHSDIFHGTESDEPICIDKSTRISVRQGEIIKSSPRALTQSNDH